ncbi:MAG: glycosyltransferase family 2 protein [Solirubrobacteraceae bacterium]
MGDERPPGPGVSVVIPTRRDLTALQESLSVLLGDRAVQEVIVVDDLAGVRVSRYKKALHDRVAVITTGGVGPARARQAGLERTVADVVLFLDDDVIPSGRLATGHARHHLAAGHVVVGYMPVSAPVAGSRDELVRGLYRREYAKRVATYLTIPGSVLSHLWGGNVSLRRTDALRVGLVNPAFNGRRHEDREFGLRCLQAGLTGVFDPMLAARHDYQRSIGAFLGDARAQGAELVQLHALHAAEIGPFEIRTLYAGLPAGVGPALRLLARIRSDRIVAAGLVLGVRLALQIERDEWGLRPLKLARRLKQVAGAVGDASN